MNRNTFLPTAEGEVRLLLLIDAFSSQSTSLEGRTKLAKLDFFLRYPAFLRRALAIRQVSLEADQSFMAENPIEERMVRYRYGPWDPSYFALLGSLLGRGLIYVVPYNRGLGYKTTEKGASLAARMRSESAWEEVSEATRLLKRHLNMAGNTLKNFIYDHFPEVASARWTEEL